MAAPILMQIDSLTKSYGDRMLFADVTFGVNEGDKIGFVAKNGTGKSTMLSILAGLETPDSGTVTLRNHTTVGILQQVPQFPDGATAASAAPELHGEAADRYRRMLQQVGIDPASTQPVESMSGGQRKRVALARTLAAEPDVLILDEPTNHLDIEVIEWLENYLRRIRATLLLVTHDRYFLDRVCNTIIELHRTEAFTHRGNYDYYLRKRAERIEAMGAELDRVRNTLRREQDWMSRQPQARATKAKGRIDRFYDLKERSQINLREDNVNLDGNQAGYIGNKIFEARGVCKSFGDKRVITDFEYIFARYEKVGIVGPNGAGKSTLIKLLQGLIQPDSGSIDLGTTVRFGYYSQEGIQFKPGDKVIDAVTRIADEIERRDGTRLSAQQWLTRFLFSVPDSQKYISTLSGGELCRLHLATVLMQSPNFLILDEPTNDLDLVTLGVLEEYLASFKGCAIVISHDRYFLDNIVDHLFVLPGNGEPVKDFPGNYSDYRAFCDAQRSEERQASRAVETPKSAERPRTERRPRLSFKEKQELEALTAEIEALTAEKSELEALFNSGAVIPDADAKGKRYAEVGELLDEKEMRWLELSEKE